MNGPLPSFTLNLHFYVIYIVKLREREGQRVDLGRLLKGLRVGKGYLMVTVGQQG